MAGSRKGKQKKKKERSNPQKSDATNKQIGLSNSKSDLGQKEGDIHDGSNKSEDCEEIDQLEKILYIKIEVAYREACKMVLNLGYNLKSTQKALLSAGVIVGDGNILSSIMRNALTLIHSSPQIDGGEVIFDKEPIFEDINELINFWIQALENLVLSKFPGLTKVDALLHILSSKSLEIERTHEEELSPSEVEGSSSSNSFSGDKFDFDSMLMDNVAAFERLNLTYTPELVSQMEKIATNSVVNQQEVVHQSSSQSNQTSKTIEFDDDSLDPLESFIGCYDETGFQDWVMNSCDHLKDQLFLSLDDLIASLEQQVEDSKEWAEKKEKEALERLNRHNLELDMLRLEKEQREQIKKEKEELANTGITNILKKEIDRRKENRQLDQLNHKLKKLEAESLLIRSELTASTLDESEAKKNLKQVVKKEKDYLKKIENLDKQFSRVQGQIHEEKQMILQLEQELQSRGEAQKASKLKLKEEAEEKGLAHDLFLDERRLTRITRENASARLASLQEQLEKEREYIMDHKEWALNKLSLLQKVVQSSSNRLPSCVLQGGGSQSSAAAAEEMIPLHRLCISCLRKEVSLIFLPCAHQVLCFDCNERVGEKCPCCKVQIVQRIRVYGGNSSV